MNARRRIDPRWLQLGVLAVYAAGAREFFNFPRPHWVSALAVASAVLVDLAIGRLRFKVLRFPLSAAIIGLASSILVYSPSFWVYAWVAVLGVLAKGFLLYRGHHLFNPANFGVVVVLLLLPTSVSAYPGLFSGYFWPMAVFAALGLLTSWYARQLEVSLAWIGGFLVFGVVRALFLSIDVPMTLAPALGPAFLLFTFHMITDPATCPRTRNWRLAFGVSVALLDAIARAAQVPNGMFYALALVTATMPWVRERERRSAREV